MTKRNVKNLTTEEAYAYAEAMLNVIEMNKTDKELYEKRNKSQKAFQLDDKEYKDHSKEKLDYIEAISTELPLFDGDDSEQASTDGPPVSGTCSACGCTEDNACEGGCSWADEQKTLCTQCKSKGGKSTAKKKAKAKKSTKKTKKAKAKKAS